MPDLSTIALFALASLALTMTPGPDMALIASRSLGQGREAGFATLAGIQAGTYLHAVAAAFGLSQLFVVVPMAYDGVRWAGAAYLLYLAWASVRSGGAAFAPTGVSPHLPLRRIFMQGLVTNLLNPKMVLFVLALFPQFMKPESGSIVGQTLILATILNLVGLAVNGTVILAVGHFSRGIVASPRFTRVPQYVLGGVFTALALRLALSDR
jgi:threonine/homoserine/homoserine lactone efflux protein